jgi:hypothetical protein
MLHDCPTAALTVELRARRAGLLKKDNALKNSYWLFGTRLSVLADQTNTGCPYDLVEG